MLKRVINSSLLSTTLNRTRYCNSYTRSYSTIDEIRLKTKIPVFKSNDDSGEHIAIGKLKESDHSVALFNLEFIKIDSIINLTPEELSRLVVIPKGEKLSVEQRLEKLESEILKYKQLVDKLSPPKPGAPVDNL
eukprot:gene4283-5357_t